MQEYAATFKAMEPGKSWEDSAPIHTESAPFPNSARAAQHFTAVAHALSKEHGCVDVSWEGNGYEHLVNAGNPSVNADGSYNF